MKKIAIFGYNTQSFEAISRLDQTTHDILIVETDPERIERAKQKGYQTANIDFRSDDALKSIGIGNDLDIIFCFLPEDSSNVFLTLSARTIDPKINIISIVEAPQADEKLIAAGANKIIDPYQLCGQKIHELITKPDITNIIDHTVFGRHDLHISEIVIPKDSFLSNTSTNDLILSKQHNIVLLGIVDRELDDQLHFAIGEKNHKIDAGDTLVILGSSREINAFKKQVEHVKSN